MNRASGIYRACRLVRRWLVAASACVCLSGMVVACNVPVFRFALDHWMPDAYRVTIIANNAEQIAQARAKLEQFDRELATGQVNWALTSLETSAGDPASQERLLQSLGIQANQLPLVVLKYPGPLGIEQPVLVSTVDKLDPRTVVSSAVRTELMNRLANGQSAVWLLVKSSDPAKNEAATSLISAQLEQLSSTLELPKLTDAPDDKIVGGPALRIEFSMIEIDRREQSEQTLLAMLLGSEPDLQETDEPILFPVFGRARVLWPLVGAGINAANLTEAASFVTGACSCQVKEQNPGFDLLVSANWDKLLPWSKDATKEMNMRLAAAKAELVPIPQGVNRNAISHSADATDGPRAGSQNADAPEEDASQRIANVPRPTSSDQIAPVIPTIWVVVGGIGVLGSAIWFLFRKGR